MADNTNGGAHSSRVTVRLNPIVALSVGNQLLKLKVIMMLVIIRDIHHTFQSRKARRSPVVCPPSSVCFSSPTPASSSMRFMARRRSSGLSQRVVEGKSGRMKMAQSATKIVSEPSMKNSHLQAACPSLPSMPSRMPEAISEPKALEMMLPQ